MLLCLAAGAGCDSPQSEDGADTREPVAPPALRHMVVAPEPRAASVGRDILRAGGGAVDAAIAVQLVLTLVEAPETGIGGGGFLLRRDGDTGDMVVYDGRETAPAAARADRFRWLGLPLPKWLAVPSGRSVGVPGMLAMLAHAHREHGRLPWDKLFEPAITLARDGFVMSPFLRSQILSDPSLRLFPGTRRTLLAAARQQPPVLRNPPLARLLERVAARGPNAFYRGEAARSLVAAAAARRPGGSDMTRADLAGYESRRRPPVCGGYREWTVCGPPPPSSGGLALLQGLAMLERFPMAGMTPSSTEAIHLVAEASRLAFADRGYYVGDPDAVDVPLPALLEDAYLTARSGLIDPRRAMPVAHAGEPGGDPRIRSRPAAGPGSDAGTSHTSIVDAEGNGVALTGSIEVPFGSRIMTDGYLLNNQLTDFDFGPLPDGSPSPNAVAGGKRPRSSMSPVIVLDGDGELRLIIGSRGGSRIIGYVLKALIGVLDWDMDVEDAIALPNFLHRGVALELERGTALEDHAQALRTLGHEVRVVALQSGLHAIERTADGWRGGADLRRGGAVRGD